MSTISRAPRSQVLALALVVVPARTPLITTVALFAEFGAGSAGLWAFFRFRRPQTDGEPTS
ncbi:MAG: hypothetical protein ACR2GO_06275 [Candidatus Limnocylindria bacterium]